MCSPKTTNQSINQFNAVGRKWKTTKQDVHAPCRLGAWITLTPTHLHTRGSRAKHALPSGTLRGPGGPVRSQARKETPTNNRHNTHTIRKIFTREQASAPKTRTHKATWTNTITRTTTHTATHTRKATDAHASALAERYKQPLEHQATDMRPHRHRRPRPASVTGESPPPLPHTHLR